MNRDHMLRDTCSWQSYTGESENATHGHKTQDYAAAVTLACIVGQPSYRWMQNWPDVSITRAMQLTLPANCTVKVQDKVTVSSKAYRVIDVQDWRGAGYQALLERIDGIT